MYDQFVKRYAALVRDGALKSIVGPLAERLLNIASELEGVRVLDAGCGEGHLARALARRGARVLAIDASPRLIELARRADPDAGLGIEYVVSDLSQPLRRTQGTFALVLGNLVLDDIADHRGFAASMAEILESQGRLVRSLNNPYSSVLRAKVASISNRGLWERMRGCAARASTSRSTTERWRSTLPRSAMRGSSCAVCSTSADPAAMICRPISADSGSASTGS